MITKTREEAAKYIGVSFSMFKKSVQKELREIRIGRRVLFDVNDLDAYLESKKVGGNGQEKVD